MITFLFWLFLGIIYYIAAAEIRYYLYSWRSRRYCYTHNTSALIGWVIGGTIGLILVWII